jgi:hypothetical protein
MWVGLYDSLVGIDHTIKILHILGYAYPYDWSDPIPLPSKGHYSARCRAVILGSIILRPWPANLMARQILLPAPKMWVTSPAP